jgi:hypothetical protein
MFCQICCGGFFPDSASGHVVVRPRSQLHQRN